MEKEVLIYDQSLTEGDFVCCNDCGKYMLLPYGMEKCLDCESQNLSWVDEGQEKTIDELINEGYKIKYEKEK